MLKYVPKDVVNELKKIDLLTYLKNYEPNELVKLDRQNYSVRSHDSVIINNGLWHRFSTNYGGKCALDYFIKVNNWDFLYAVNYLLDKVKIQKPVIYFPKKNNIRKVFKIPKREKNNKKAIEYLKNRGIDEEIINYCIRNKLIFQEKYLENVIFLGYDNLGNIKYAMRRSINDNEHIIKGEVGGSNKKYTFRLLSNSKKYIKNVHLFESAIDLLSYATLLKMSGYSWNESNLISLRRNLYFERRYE